MPFTNAYHGDDGAPPSARREPASLADRIDAELCARIEDAVDYACLDAMVRAREALGSPSPVASDPHDRTEFTSRVRTFLERLRVDIIGQLSAEQRQRLGDAVAPPRTADIQASLAVQVSLAKELPDYWQRFETVRTRTLGDAPPSGSERRGLLDRLLGRG